MHMGYRRGTTFDDGWLGGRCGGRREEGAAPAFRIAAAELKTPDSAARMLCGTSVTAPLPSNKQLRAAPPVADERERLPQRGA
jgi:hypothetical protein